MTNGGREVSPAEEQSCQFEAQQPQYFSSTHSSYTIRITDLFKYYFDGGLSDSGPPSAASGGWANASIGDVYIGIETWGKETTAIEIDNYKLYSYWQ